MKRFGNLIPIICTRENIERSIKTVLRGNKRKRTKAARYFLSHMDETIDAIIECISSGKFRLGAFRQVTIKEGEKGKSNTDIWLLG